MPRAARCSFTSFVSRTFSTHNAASIFGRLLYPYGLRHPQGRERKTTKLFRDYFTCQSPPLSGVRCVRRACAKQALLLEVISGWIVRPYCFNCFLLTSFHLAHWQEWQPVGVCVFTNNDMTFATLTPAGELGIIPSRIIHNV